MAVAAGQQPGPYLFPPQRAAEGEGGRLHGEK